MGEIEIHDDVGGSLDVGVEDIVDREIGEKHELVGKWKGEGNPPTLLASRVLDIPMPLSTSISTYRHIYIRHRHIDISIKLQRHIDTSRNQ